jgi:predicted HTH domain antitoxin
METKLKFPDEVMNVIEKPVEKSLIELIAIGLYRDGKITLRQAADLIGINIKKMHEILKKHNTYVSYGIKELEEDIAYATSGE